MNFTPKFVPDNCLQKVGILNLWQKYLKKKKKK